MSSRRIIRPAGESAAIGSGADGSGALGSGAVELNLEDVRALGRQMLREARARVEEYRREERELEEAIRARRSEAEREAGERRRALDEELDTRRREALAELQREREECREEARREGWKAGHAEGLEKGREEGREAGYREGREDEIRRIGAETRELVATLRAVVEELGRRREDLLDGARRELIRLAVEIARRIVKREVSDAASEVVLENVRQAVDLVFLRHRIVVQVHESDLEAIETYARDALDALAGAERFDVRAARDIARGGCRVLSGTGVVDLSLDVQLEEIERALLARFGPDSAAAAVPLPPDGESRADPRRGRVAAPIEEVI